MIEQYEIVVEFKLFPTGEMAAIDKDGKATVIVYLDWKEFEFANGNDWDHLQKHKQFIPPKSVTEIHQRMCEEILEDVGNSNKIQFYTGAEEREDGTKPWTDAFRISFTYVAALTVNFDQLALLVSVDSDDDGAPTREALARLRRAVADAKARYDDRVEEWFWSDPDYR